MNVAAMAAAMLNQTTPEATAALVGQTETYIPGLTSSRRLEELTDPYGARTHRAIVGERAK